MPNERTQPMSGLRKFLLTLAAFFAVLLLIAGITQLFG
jgi:hypothetical protein